MQHINKKSCKCSVNKPPADRGSLSLVYTCTVNGISDGTSEMIVNDMEPSDSTALPVSFSNCTTAKK